MGQGLRGMPVSPQPGIQNNCVAATVDEISEIRGTVPVAQGMVGGMRANQKQATTEEHQGEQVDDGVIDAIAREMRRTQSPSIERGRPTVR